MSAYSYKREHIYIINHSDQNIKVTAEFLANQNVAAMRSWEQDIGDINVNVRMGIFFEAHVYILHQKETIEIVSYSPNYTSFKFSEYYYKLQNLSIKDKLNAIFKSLVIYSENGETLLVLEDLNDTNTRLVSTGNISRYYIDVYTAASP
jgi:hypothetical protein